MVANNQTKTYGDREPPLIYQADGLVNSTVRSCGANNNLVTVTLNDGNVITGSLVRDPGEEVGDYTIRQGTLAASGNYNLRFRPGTLHINGRTLSVSPSAEHPQPPADAPELLWPSIGRGVKIGRLSTRNWATRTSMSLGARSHSAGHPSPLSPFAGLLVAEFWGRQAYPTL